MDAARQLREAVRRFVVAHEALEEARRPCGTPLPIPHAYALLELLHDGPMTVSALAARLSIDRTNVSRLCARMEEAGELVREAHPDDGRARLLTLTSQGEDVARGVDASSAAYFRKLVDRLGDRRGHVVEALGVLAEALRTPAHPQDPE